MPPWMLALVASLAVPMVLDKAKTQAPQVPSAGGPAPGPGGMYVPPMLQAQAAPSSPIPLDAGIDATTASAVVNAWNTAPADALLGFAREIMNRYPIAGAGLFARGLTFQQIAAVQAQARAQMEAQARQAQIEAQARAQAAQAVVPNIGGSQVVPAQQSARIIPSPSLIPIGAEPQAPVSQENGAVPMPASIHVPHETREPVAVG